MTTEHSLEQGTQKLRPRARLIRAIGDQLISNETVALLELVKNSYDADSTFVYVAFVGPLEPGGGKVVVADNGQGMSLETLRGAWMEPATEWKTERPRSDRFNRRVLGEKGLGRFAAARLADYFYVSSRQRDGNFESRVLLDWSAFDHPDKYLDEIEVLWETTSPKEIYAGSQLESKLYSLNLIAQEGYCHGTVLSLEGLRKDWLETDVEHIRRSLARLISPMHAGVNGGFSIYLDAPHPFEEYSGVVSPPTVFDHPHYRVDGVVDPNGHCSLEFKNRDQVTIIKKHLFNRDELSPRCGPISLGLRIWNRDQKSLKDLALGLDLSIKDIRNDINAIGGVNIYRDGFRILPYGEYGNDWIGLDLRRVQNPTLRISNNQVSGYVFVTAEENPLLIDQSNREGLFENQAVKDLKELIKRILHEVEQVRYKDLHQRPKAGPISHSSGLFDPINLDKLRDAVKAKLPDDKEIIEAINENQTTLNSSLEKIKSVFSRYQRLATMGSLIDMILHEGRQPISRIRLDADSVKNLLEAPNPSQSLFRANKLLENIDVNADVVSKAFKKLDPFSGRKRGRPQDVVLEDAIRSGIELLRTDLDKARIDCVLLESRTLVRADPADIQIITKNFVENSIYWLKTSENVGRIEISACRDADGAVEMRFSDSGPGVPLEFVDEIWNPYFTTKPDGVGLGLSIVGEIVHDLYDGELQLTESVLGGASFVVTLKRKVE